MTASEKPLSAGCNAALNEPVDISIIYVNWNSEAAILQSIQSVRGQVRGVTFEIIVVDNDSAQGTALLEAEDGIRLVKNSHNAGFGAGCNLGVLHSNGRHLFFFNPDTRMENDAVTILSKYLDKNPGVAAVGPQVLGKDGTVLLDGARSFHDLTNEFLEHSNLTFRFPKGRWTGRPYYSYWNRDSTREVDSLIGAAMLFRREVFSELGGFDERFFLYCEEVDLCKRTWDLGCSIRYVHNAVITHYAKHSADQYFEDSHALIMQHLRSLKLYMRKHHGLCKTVAWRGMIIVLYAMKAIRNRDKRYLNYCRIGFSNV